ncbi:MAG: hypothetical protein IPO56_16480 [Flavobacteriales bacterium]|nr:hypothetical protein [Flavobacteriales bacterium]
MYSAEYFEVTSVDFTSPAIDLMGISSRVMVDGILMLWAGDVSFNDDILYVGLGNDRDPVLITIGGSVPTATAIGYHLSDVTLDGMVKYVGPGNDRDPILVTIGGSTPTAVRSAPISTDDTPNKSPLAPRR